MAAKRKIKPEAEEKAKKPAKAKTEAEAVKPTVEVAEVETDVEQTDAESTTDAVAEAPKKKPKAERRRSKQYLAVRAQVDKTKKYDVFAAVELVKKLSYTSFEGTIIAHAVVKEVGLSVPLTLPHSTGKAIRVVIVDDQVLKDIEAGQINFDILLAAPNFMPKLAKFASTLGPKGLMPNPKNGTLTPKPEAQKTKLEAGTVTIKTEKKAPLMHIRIGKTKMDTKELVANTEALIKAIGMKLDRLTLAASMSPGVKVNTTSSVS